MLQNNQNIESSGQGVNERISDEKSLKKEVYISRLVQKFSETDPENARLWEVVLREFLEIYADCGFDLKRFSNYLYLFGDIKAREYLKFDQFLSAQYSAFTKVDKARLKSLKDAANKFIFLTVLFYYLRMRKKPEHEKVPQINFEEFFQFQSNPFQDYYYYDLGLAYALLEQSFPEFSFISIGTLHQRHTFVTEEFYEDAILDPELPVNKGYLDFKEISLKSQKEGAKEKLDVERELLRLRFLKTSGQEIGSLEAENAALKEKNDYLLKQIGKLGEREKGKEERI